MITQRKKRIILYFLAFAIVACIGLYFRLYPVMFKTSSETDAKAAMFITSQMQLSNLKKINELYPGLPEEKKQMMAQEKFAQAIAGNPEEARKAIYQFSQELYKRNLEKNSGEKAPEMYLTASDPYYFYGLTKELVKGNKIMAKRNGAKYFNEKMLSPIGYWEAISLHPFVGYGIYKIVSKIVPDASLMFALSFTPLFLMLLSCIVFFLICYKLRLQVWASFISATLLFLAPIFLRRSFFGWYDSDPYNILFPLLITFIFLLGLKKKLNTRNSIIFGILCAVALSLYAFFWQGWVYLFSILFLSGCIILPLNHFLLTEPSRTKNLLIYFASIFGGTFLGILLSFGPKEFFFLFQEGFKVLGEFFSSKLSVWPDVYLSVGELHRASFSELLSLSGGAIFFIFSILGILLLGFSSIKNKNFETWHKTVFFILFFFSSLIMSIKAERFVLLLLVPLSILSAVSLDFGYKVMRKFLAKKCTNPIILNSIFIALILIVGAVIVMPSLKKADNWASRLRPIFNETWDRALTKIKNETPENSIINTWWSPGHFIKSVAERRVTFDGATINVPQAYWMGNILLNSDETKALGLLRMLNASGNQATEYLETIGLKKSDSIKILNKITTLPRDKAKEYLKRNLNSTQSEELLNLTHSTPDPSYLFLYNDLIESIIGVAFVGRWDIEKIEEINKNPNRVKEVKGNGLRQYIDFMWTLQGGIPRISQPLIEAQKDDAYVYFSQGIRVKQDNMDCEILSKEFGVGIPKSIIYKKGDQIVEKKFPNANLSYCVIFVKNDYGKFECILMDEFLAHSLAIKLYYLDGTGLRYFVPFLKEQSRENKTEICVYKINWESFMKDLNGKEN
ncbi:MAG: STT3 domain-containing protein [Candidatus Omnitrophica bacterium]|nr:STT3 domain-containing protein [Candidatus Omnitrophota bacterium]